MTREEILGRYRHLRAISAGHHSAALAFVSRSMLLEQAKRLGIAQGRMLMPESKEEMALVFDLSLYTAREGRSRAVDRYARAARLPLGSDEALVLEAMRQARFSIWRVDRRHETTGMIITDLLRQREEWLVDEKLEASAPDGMAVAGRICEPDSFAMTCGVIVPVNRNLVEEATLDTLAWRRGNPEHVAQDPRFAMAIYRAAIDTGVMENVAYE